MNISINEIVFMFVGCFFCVFLIVLPMMMVQICRHLKDIRISLDSITESIDDIAEILDEFNK